MKTRIKELRTAANMTQQQLADAIGTIKGMYQVSFEGCQGREQLGILGVPSMGLIMDCQSAFFSFQDLSP